MNTQRCLKIAERMNALLLNELGQGVDGLRMVAEPLYARDVLLVCDAMPGTELADLARHFRVAGTEKTQPRAAPSPPAAGTGRDGAKADSRRGKRSPTRDNARSNTHSNARDTPRDKTRNGTGQGQENGPERAQAQAHGGNAGTVGTPGFGTSIWSRIASGFGLTTPGDPSSPDSQPETAAGAAAQPPQERWFSPSRWRAGSK